jgi:hypothetical protein
LTRKRVRQVTSFWLQTRTCWASRTSGIFRS